MEFNKRVKDVSQVFDSQWNVNHNYSEVKKFHDNRREYFMKLHNIQDKDKRNQEILRANSVDGRVEALNHKMNSMNSNMNMAKRNEFRNNFR